MHKSAFFSFENVAWSKFPWFIYWKGTNAVNGGSNGKFLLDFSFYWWQGCKRTVYSSFLLVNSKVFEYFEKYTMMNFV